MPQVKSLENIFEYNYIMEMSYCAKRDRLSAPALGLIGALAAAPAPAAELVMFERAGCPWCQRWDAEVAPAYAASPEGLKAPLRRHNLDTGQPKDLALARPVRYTPTFVLIDDRREIGRITGYIDNGMFWGLLTPMIAKIGKSSGASSRAPEPNSGE